MVFSYSFQILVSTNRETALILVSGPKDWYFPEISMAYMTLTGAGSGLFPKKWAYRATLRIWPWETSTQQGGPRAAVQGPLKALVSRQSLSLFKLLPRTLKANIHMVPTEVCNADPVSVLGSEPTLQSRILWPT